MKLLMEARNVILQSRASVVRASLMGLLMGSWLGLLFTFASVAFLDQIDAITPILRNPWLSDVTRNVVAVDVLSALTGFLIIVEKLGLLQIFAGVWESKQRAKSVYKIGLLVDPLTGSADDLPRRSRYKFLESLKTLLGVVALIANASAILLLGCVCGVIVGSTELMSSLRLLSLAVVTTAVTALVVESFAMLRPLWILSEYMTLAEESTSEDCVLCGGNIDIGHIRLASPSSAPECSQHASHLYCFLDRWESSKCPSCASGLDVYSCEFEEAPFSWFYFFVLFIYGRGFRTVKQFSRKCFTRQDAEVPASDLRCLDVA